MLFYTKRFSFLLAIAGLLIFAGVPVAHGQSVVTDTPISAQVFTNSCNGDMVTLSGTAHQEMVFSTNPNGMTHFSMNSTVHMTGAGTPSGASYVANDPSHMETNTRGVAQEQFIATTMHLISQTAGVPNMIVRGTLHVVIGSDNSVKVEMSKFQSKCN